MGAQPTARLAFSPRQRLKRGGDFLRLRSEGRRVACGCLVGNWSVRSGASASRLGVITSRKVGNAVVRNRARRLLREAFRLHQNDLAQHLDLVLVARNSIDGKAFAGVEADYLEFLRRARLLKGER